MVVVGVLGVHVLLLPVLGLLDLPVVAVGAEKAVPQFDVLGKVALGVGVVAGVEAGVEEEDAEVEAAVSERSDEAVHPQAS